MGREISISVEAGDVTTFSADVLVLKYAQDLYGADALVYGILSRAHIQLSLPPEEDFSFGKTLGSISAANVLFVGVKDLSQFAYAEIREFAHSALGFLAGRTPTIQRIALTIHGPGYGLDEAEAFESELAGVVDAITSGDFPRTLTNITFVERDPYRVRRLSTLLKKVLPTGNLPVDGHASLTTLRDKKRAKHPPNRRILTISGQAPRLCRYAFC